MNVNKILFIGIYRYFADTLAHNETARPQQSNHSSTSTQPPTAAIVNVVVEPGGTPTVISSNKAVRIPASIISTSTSYKPSGDTSSNFTHP